LYSRPDFQKPVQGENFIMKLSIVILCWNDSKVIAGCLRSIYACTHEVDFEVIVSDNGSTDGSQECIRRDYPSVRIIENRANLGFARGNNVGIEESSGEYILILNPDTIIHEGALDRLVAFADRHPGAGGFGCRVLNPDGSYQGPARPFPTIWRDWMAVLCLRKLAYLSDRFISDTYTGWNGDTVREIDWQSGCCVMLPSALLKRLHGFDEQFFYHFEEVDLCRRVWSSGHPILYSPDPHITHLGGQSVNRFPVRFELERYRSRYRYYYKHFGPGGARRCRHAVLGWIRLRQLGYGLLRLFSPSEGLRKRMEMYRWSAQWNQELDPVRFVEAGEEPDFVQELALQVLNGN
jgi:N-acetylglucosaminyl-diphospho-decaprenol L-rhamnosyltransferase